LTWGNLRGFPSRNKGPWNTERLGGKKSIQFAGEDRGGGDLKDGLPKRKRRGGSSK